MRVALLCGGLGGARLAPFLAARNQLTAICNVADDMEWMGLHVSPDVDAVVYALAGLFDHERGYGIRDDTTHFMALLMAAGEDGWFHVGDRDLYTHVLRTALLQIGRPLSAATVTLCRALSVQATVLPASDHPVRTTVTAEGRELDFQTFYVRKGAEMRLDGVRWEGLDYALPAPGLIPTITEADLVVFGESSPIGSILPILKLPGVRAALAATKAVRVALSPVMVAVPPHSYVDRHHWQAREQLLRAQGLGHDPATVASLYRGVLDVFILDHRDSRFVPAVAGLGMTALTRDLLDRSHAGRDALARTLERLAEPV